MTKKDYAVIFERVGHNKEKGYFLRVLDYVEGEEKNFKGGKKAFFIDKDFKQKYMEEEIKEDPFYQYLFEDNKVKYMEDEDSLSSKYVYGSPTSTAFFKEIINCNTSNGLFDLEFAENGLEKSIEQLKEDYIEALRNYDFYQGFNVFQKLVTYTVRKEPINILVPMDNVLEEIVESEFDIKMPDGYGEEKYKEVFKAIPTSIDIKKVYEECKKYVIGQDAHIMSVLGAIDDNLTATIPEEKINILVAGSTGVGKTAVFKRIADTIGLPMVIENATQFTKAGYVGRNIDDIFEDLLQVANNDKELAQRGIIFIDEIDKKASGKDDSVSGVGVIQSMLKLLEGGEYFYETGKGSYSELKKFNTLNTTIALGGAFSGLKEQCISKEIGFVKQVKTMPIDAFNVENLDKYGIPPEFVGRIHLIELFDDLSVDVLKRILIEAKVNPLSLFLEKMKRYNTTVKNDEEFIEAIATEAYKRKMGARGLYSIMKNATKIAESEIRLMSKEEKELILTPELIDNNKAYTLKRTCIK